jgi:DNA anti-recombination protein RmuC
MELLTHSYFGYAVGFLILVFPFFFSSRMSRYSATSLAATLGIFGTFLGIFAGLLTFNVHDIESSVPKLLEGLKTAFITSLAGMLVGIIIKVKPGFYGFRADNRGQEKQGTAAVLALLSEIRDLNGRQITNQTILLQNIERALCGDGDTTVLTQLQKIRTSFSDKQDELIKEFRSFVTTMAENNSKALIDALTEVMRDFNTKINEQFGENFKHLNQAVEKILIWQKKYKEEVEQMILAFDKCLQGVEQSERNLAEINNHSEKFSELAEDLGLLVVDLERKKSEVESGLSSFAEVAREAKSALPNITQQVNALTKEFTATVSASLAEISGAVSTINSTVSKQSEGLIKSQDVLRTNLEAMVKGIGEATAKQVAELDRALGEELTKSLTTLSSQLHSLSARFVNDYSPLTDKLREVISLSRQINS